MNELKPLAQRNGHFENTGNTRVRQPGALAWLEGAPARVDNRSINRLAASLDGGGSLIIDLLLTYYSLIIHLFALSVGMSNWS